MSDAPTYLRSPSALWRRVGVDVLVADPAGSDVDRLSVPASAAWLLLERPRTAEELTRLLAGEFSVAEGEIEGKVVSLVEELESRGWLIRERAGVASGVDE